MSAFGVTRRRVELRAYAERREVQGQAGSEVDSTSATSERVFHWDRIGWPKGLLRGVWARRAERARIGSAHQTGQANASQVGPACVEPGSAFARRAVLLALVVRLSPGKKRPCPMLQMSPTASPAIHSDDDFFSSSPISILPPLSTLNSVREL
jgi:hypothetical protein